MKGLPCPCPILPRCWLLGARFMADGQGAPAPGTGPPVSVRLLRAQYEGQRQQQRTQARMLVLPTGSAPAPVDLPVNAVWINKQKDGSLDPKRAAIEAEDLKGEAGRGCPRPTSPWHTHLEMHRTAQTPCGDPGPPAKLQGQLPGSLPRPLKHGGPSWMGNCRPTQPGVRRADRVAGTQMETGDASRDTATPCPPAQRGPRQPGKAAHYPFPQRKAPRVSQAARNLGLYGPV